jgi:hypothetical protein
MVSLARAYGASNGTAFHCVTIVGVDVPTPRTNRPGARSAIVAALIASRPGPRV